MRRSAIFVFSLAAVTAAAVPAFADPSPPPPAHEHHMMSSATSGVHASDLVIPGIVHVEDVATGFVAVAHRGVPYAERGTIVDASGTGVVVNDRGIVLTPSTTVARHDDAVRIQLTNRLFARFGLPLPDDARQHRINPTSEFAQDLHDCYAAVPESSCLFSVSHRLRLTPLFVTGQPRTFSPGAFPAVAGVTPLRYPASNIATDALATKAAAGSVVIVGLPKSPMHPGELPTVVSAHLTSNGSGLQIEDAEMEHVHHMLSGITSGAVVADAKTGQVTGLLQANPGDDPSFVPVEALSTALKASGLAAEQTVVDLDYQTALGHYADQHYTLAAASFQHVLQLDPQQPLASTYFRTAHAKAGGPQDMAEHEMAPLTPVVKHGKKHDNYVWIGIGAAVVVLLLLITWLLRRRRVRRGRTQPADSPAPSAAASRNGDHAAADQPFATTVRPAMDLTDFAQRPGKEPAVVGGAAAKHFCMQCGQGLPSSARFCPACGNAVG